jgi:lipopolysaccharide biosynthesis protein
MLTIPPEDTPKNSDAWLGHLQRRHQHRAKINKAATHPRMYEKEHSSAFTIAAVAGGFEVRATHTAASKNELAKRLATLTVTKRKQLAYLMQSTDWLNLPPHERAVAETIYDDIVALEEDTSKSAERISSKLERLEHRIQRALDAGDICSQNGGIQRLLERVLTENEDEDDSVE